MTLYSTNSGRTRAYCQNKNKLLRQSASQYNIIYRSSTAKEGGGHPCVRLQYVNIILCTHLAKNTDTSLIVSELCPGVCNLICCQLHDL